MGLESIVPYKIMQKERVEKALGELPNSSKRLIGNFYLIRTEDVKKVYDVEKDLAFIRSIFERAEEAKRRASYMNLHG